MGELCLLLDLFDVFYVQNIDLHALTGWIPERVAIRRSDASSEEAFNADREFQRIYERFHNGHCLVTVATGELTGGAAERAGLVPTHAYAMLNIQIIQVYNCCHVVKMTTFVVYHVQQIFSGF